jgi:hypothetical protein
VKGQDSHDAMIDALYSKEFKDLRQNTTLPEYFSLSGFNLKDTFAAAFLSSFMTKSPKIMAVTKPSTFARH